VTGLREEASGAGFTGSRRKVGRTVGPSGGSRRQWKANKVVKRMVLGSDIGLKETCRLALCGLVGRISYRNCVICRSPFGLSRPGVLF
jgi:hypothetical protein